MNESAAARPVLSIVRDDAESVQGLLDVAERTAREDWYASLREKVVNEKARTTAIRLLAEEIGADAILTNDYLLSLCGFAALPTDATEAERVALRLAETAYFSALSTELLTRSGRFLERVRGVGYRLLLQKDSPIAIERRESRETELALAKGIKRTRLVLPHVSEPEERTRITDSLSSRGSFLQGIRRKQREFDLFDPAHLTTPKSVNK